MKCIAPGVVAVLGLMTSPALLAQQTQARAANIDTDRVGNYRTREERREAGLGTELTDWLTFSGLVEVESIREVTQFDVGLRDHYDYSTDPAVQAAFDVSLFDIFEAELIFEYTEDSREPIMDEFIVAGDFGNIGINAGRFYVPFGLYYSHFINGPFIEFAETRRDTVQVDYDFEDRIEFSLYAFAGETRKSATASDETGWGTSVDALLMDGRLNIGGGFLSNLAESEERFLREENNVFLNKVGAWNAYAVYEANDWGLSFEILQATQRFREFDRTEDKPMAWNLESAYYFNDNFEIALRYERSKELIDSAAKQYGIALTWRLANRISFSAEYLRGDYKRDFVEEDDDIFAADIDTLAIWFAFEF